MNEYNRTNISEIIYKKSPTAEEIQWLRCAPRKYQSQAIKNKVCEFERNHKYSFIPQDSQFKARLWTFALVHDNERVKRLVEAHVPKFAYICHDKDPDTESHFHYYLEYSNPVYLNPLAEKLDIPAHMIEKVDCKKAFLNYLTHENSQDKHHYDPSEIIANFDVCKESVEAEKQAKRSFFFRHYCSPSGSYEGSGLL